MGKTDNKLTEFDSLPYDCIIITVYKKTTIII